MKISPTLKLLASATLCAFLLPTAQAGEPIEIGNGLRLEWSLGLTYALGMRTKNPNAFLASDDTNYDGNDGNNNFKKGSLTTNRLSGLLETHLSKGNTGLVFTGTAFYDDVYHSRTHHNGKTDINTPQNYRRFTHEAQHKEGGYARLLDTYAYTVLDLGQDRSLDLRVGRQVVNWGEATYFANISGAQGPFDGAKSDIPGTEIKESILPEDQVSVALQLSPDLTLLGHWQFGFNETLLPSVGSFLSTTDIMGPGGSCMFGPYVGGDCWGIPRIKDDKPSETSQWGIGARYRLTGETEVGLYYLNYNDRTPSLILAPDYSSYHIRYFDNIKMIAGTLSTTFRKFSAYGELSYRDGTPLMVTDGEYVRANVTQLNIGGLYNIGRTVVAPDMVLLAELSGVKVNSISKGRSFDELYFKTRNSLALAGTWVMDYPGIASGWDLSIPIGYSHQLYGRSLVGTHGGGQGTRNYSVGAEFTYNDNLMISAAYVGYLGSATDDPRSSKDMVDRDQVTLNFKYMF